MTPSASTRVCATLAMCPLAPYLRPAAACFRPQVSTLSSYPRLSVPHADGEGGTAATRVSQTAGGGFSHSSGVQSVFLPFCMW